MLIAELYLLYIPLTLVLLNKLTLVLLNKLTLVLLNKLTLVLLNKLTLVLLNPDIPCFANSVDPDQLASEEAN